jgi:ABC-2 type transport system ATP-binding protein
MSSAAVLVASGLEKRYGKVEAVRGVDLHVEPGEIYGLIGKNGAGKTTTIRLMLGLVSPSRGHVCLFGERVRPGNAAVLARVGALVETAAAYPNLTVRENLEVRRRLTRSPASSVGESVALLGLAGCVERPAGELSLGNKQRLAIACALLHRPRLVVLDEPTNGLDPEGIVEVRQLLAHLARERGVAVLLSSHHLSEVARLADRLGIMHAGRLVEELTNDELRQKARRCITLDVSDPEGALALLSNRFGADDVEHLGGGRLRLSGPSISAAEVARVIVGGAVDLESLAVELEDLEGYFLRLTREAA